MTHLPVQITGGDKILNLKVTMTHTVPMETPQSMLEEPSSGSKQTQYLNREKTNARHDQGKQQYDVVELTSQFLRWISND